jgi:hypothetical protein
MVYPSNSQHYTSPSGSSFNPNVLQSELNILSTSDSPRPSDVNNSSTVPSGNFPRPPYQKPPTSTSSFQSTASSNESEHATLDPRSWALTFLGTSSGSPFLSRGCSSTVLEIPQTGYVRRLPPSFSFLLFNQNLSILQKSISLSRT